MSSTMIEEFDRESLLTVLNAFTRSYLYGVDVCWRNMRSTLGCAGIGEKRIYIKPKVPLEITGLELDKGWRVSYGDALAKLRFRNPEQHFLILPHEIGHFYDRELLPPDSFTRFIREAMQWEKLPKDIRDFSFGRLNQKGRIWHWIIVRWSIYEFRRKRGEIRRRLKEAGFELRPPIRRARMK